METNAMQSASQCVRGTQRELRTFVPSVDVYELADEIRLVADLPGADPARIDVQYDRGRLNLFAPVQARHNGNQWLLREYGVGDYERSFEVGEQVDPDGIVAEYAQGVLTVHLPKADRARTRKVEVRSA